MDSARQSSPQDEGLIMTKLTLENCYGVYSVEIPEEDFTVEDVVDELMVPVLLSAGYSRNGIDEIFYPECCQDSDPE